MIVLPCTQDGPAAVLRISPELRRFIVLQNRLMCPLGRHAQKEKELARYARAGVPLAVHVRSHWPVMDPSAAERAGKLAAPAWIARVLGRFQNVAALIDSEQYALTREQREYAVELLRVCDRYGVWLIFDAGWRGGADWRELFLDPALRQALTAHGRVLLPMWEVNIPGAMYSEHSQLLGTWLAGAVPAWGANPQRWYWGEAGFAEYGEDAGWRFSRRGGMRTAAHFLNRYPFYAHSVLISVLSGASVFWIGGEQPPHAWIRDGRPSAEWTGALAPVFRFVLGHRLIPGRAALTRNIRFWIVDSAGAPFLYEGRDAARTGSHCLRLAAGAGRSSRLAWTNDDFLRLAPGQYEVSAWVRTRALSGKAYLDFTRSEAGRWRHDRSSGVSGDAPWNLLRTRARVGRDCRYAMLQLRLDGTAGDAWFDDVSIRRAGETANLAPNPGFETPRSPAGRRPAGWRPACVYGPADLQRCRRGVNRVWQAAYGLFHRAEFLPNTPSRFPGAWLPPGARPPEGTAPGALRFDAGRPNRISIPTRWLQVPPRHDSPLVWRGPGFLWIAHSAENTPASQAFDLTWNGLRVHGRCPMHHFLLATGGTKAATLAWVSYSPHGDAVRLDLLPARHAPRGAGGSALSCSHQTPRAVHVERMGNSGLRIVLDHARRHWLRFDIAGPCIRSRPR